MSGLFWFVTGWMCAALWLTLVVAWWERKERGRESTDTAGGER